MTTGVSADKHLFSALEHAQLLMFIERICYVGGILWIFKK
jgi:hypothetical protein